MMRGAAVEYRIRRDIDMLSPLLDESLHITTTCRQMPRPCRHAMMADIYRRFIGWRYGFVVLLCHGRRRRYGASGSSACYAAASELLLLLLLLCAVRCWRSARRAATAFRHSKAPALQRHKARQPVRRHASWLRAAAKRQRQRAFAALSLFASALPLRCSFAAPPRRAGGSCCFCCASRQAAFASFQRHGFRFASASAAAMLPHCCRLSARKL